MKVLIASLVGAVFSLASITADEILYLPATATEELKAKEGQAVTVHGEVGESAKSASGTNFVNFKDAEFFLVTFKSDLHQFPEGEPADVYKGKRLAIEGTVSIYQGKPQIKLTKPEQVTEIAPDAVFPPPRPVMPVAVPSEPAPKTEAPAAAPAVPETKPKPPVDPSEYFKKKE